MTATVTSCSAACGPNHVTLPVTGDVHYEISTGIPMIYDGTKWMTVAPHTGTSTMTTGTGTYTHIGYDIPPEPEEDEDGPLPERDVFVKRKLAKHKQTHDNFRCFCGAEFVGHWVNHLADIAIAACDEWDQLIMGEVDEDDIES